MAKTFEIKNGKLEVTDTIVKKEMFKLKDLRRQKKMLKDKLDAIQVLIDEAIKLGASDEQ